MSESAVRLSAAPEPWSIWSALFAGFRAMFRRPRLFLELSLVMVIGMALQQPILANLTQLGGAPVQTWGAWFALSLRSMATLPISATLLAVVMAAHTRVAFSDPEDPGSQLRLGRIELGIAACLILLSAISYFATLLVTWITWTIRRPDGVSGVRAIDLLVPLTFLVCALAASRFWLLPADAVRKGTLDLARAWRLGRSRKGGLFLTFLVSVLLWAIIQGTLRFVVHHVFAAALGGETPQSLVGFIIGNRETDGMPWWIGIPLAAPIHALAMAALAGPPAYIYSRMEQPEDVF